LDIGAARRLVIRIVHGRMITAKYNTICSYLTFETVWYRTSRACIPNKNNCQWLAAGWWFSQVSSTNKTDCHDITEILLIVTVCHWQSLSHNVVKVHLIINRFKFITSVMIGTGSCKFNYHTAMAMTAFRKTFELITQHL
jgi:hypothetical protein